MTGDTMFDIVYDAQTLITSIFGLVEFIIGISYVTGKYLTEGILEGGIILWEFGKDVVAGAQFSVQLLVEASQQILQTIFLIYYVLGHVVDAFHVTFMDLVSFLQDATRTLGMFLESCFILAVSWIGSLVVVPDQLCSALSLIGEFFLGLCQSLANLTSTIGLTLISIPIQLFHSLRVGLTFLVLLPPKLIHSIPVSAHIGLLVIIFFYFVYCRFSFRLLFRSSVNFIRRACALCVHSGVVLLNYWRKPTKIKVWNGDTNTGNKASGSKQDKKGNDLNGICVLCFEQAVAYMASPCNHICVCKDCCHRLVNADSRCPLCRKDVDVYTRVYIS